MRRLIEALTILTKYSTNADCYNSNGEFCVDVSPKLVSGDDISALHRIGFYHNDRYFYSLDYADSMLRETCEGERL